MNNTREHKRHMQNKIEYFNTMCQKYPESVQEMADDGHILDLEIIEVCMENGVTFKPDFLEEIGYKPPKLDEEVSDTPSIL